jgi:hypothetical protein
MCCKLKVLTWWNDPGTLQTQAPDHCDWQSFERRAGENVNQFDKPILRIRLCTLQMVRMPRARNGQPELGVHVENLHAHKPLLPILVLDVENILEENFHRNLPRGSVELGKALNVFINEHLWQQGLQQEHEAVLRLAVADSSSLAECGVVRLVLSAALMRVRCERSKRLARRAAAQHARRSRLWCYIAR